MTEPPADGLTTGAAGTLREEARDALVCPDPSTKAAWTRDLAQRALAAPDSALTGVEVAPPTEPLPGRPDRPRLVPVSQVPGRSAHTPQGRAALLHAIAHIEFNAINLALDAAWRFPGMPAAFYRDWLKVAGEEALHFGLLRAHLRGLGCDYGDFDAHDGLWAMTARTANDLAARLALVPRTLEARGLDATPPLQAKFAQAGDARAVEILGVILQDEVGHVAIGNHWYRWVCERDGLDPIAHTREMSARHGAPRLRPPFNLAARRAAGFAEAEIQGLEESQPPHA